MEGVGSGANFSVNVGCAGNVKDDGVVVVLGNSALVQLCAGGARERRGVYTVICLE